MQTIPPSPVVMFLLGWKEKMEMVSKEPMRRPLYSVPAAWAASSMTVRPNSLARVKRGSMSHDWPAKWTGMMALVRGVIFSRTLPISRLRVPGSMSARTGVPPQRTIMLTVEAKVMGVVMISSPSLIFRASSVRCRPAVAELKGTAYGAPT